MKKISKKISAIISMILSSVFFVSCNLLPNTNEPSNQPSGSGDGEVTLWSASTAETVLLDKSIEEYASIRKEAAINVSMAKNEYEGAQFFLTADKKVSSYDIEVGELKTSDGEVFPAENIDVYSYKYITVTRNVASHRKIGTGLYPDAILPFETTKKYEENTIEEGNNQGIYIRFYVPSECESGTYTGSVKVTYDGKTEYVPVTLNVWDLEISEENHLQTLFLVGWKWKEGEQNATEEKYYDYVEMLSEYRLSPYFLMTDDVRDVLSDDYWDRYAQVVYEYTTNPKNSCYALNYVSRDSYNFDTAEFEEMLITLAEKSFETNFNVLTKAVAHFNSLIDEATMQNKLDQTIAVTDSFREVRISASEKIRANKSAYAAEYGVTEEYVEELASTVENLKHLFVANYDEEYSPYIDADETGSGIWCPNVWEFQEPTNVDNYINNLQIDWWYGCGGFARDIPCYQLDEYTLSPRIMSWQQMYYGITGNLYWGVDFYCDWGARPDNFYDQNASVGGANGDGWLCYPGAPYELDMPVATRRLEAIRDGMEEYEMLLEMKNLYAEIAQTNGMVENSFDELYNYLTKDLFSEIHIISNADSFDYARNLMAQLLLLAKSDAQICVQDIAISSSSISGGIFVKNGYTLNCEAGELTSTALGNGKLYTFEFSLDNFVNNFLFTIPELENNNTFTLLSKGKAIFYAPSETTLAEFTDGYAKITKALVSSNEIDGGYLTESLIKINVAATNGKLQTFNMASELFNNVNENTSAIKFMIYNGSGKVQNMAIEVKYSKDSVISRLTSVQLQTGWNEITLDGLDVKKWSSLGQISYLQFVFGESVIQPSVDNIYFGGYYVTYLK
ncbi:MAG: DUF4091 domain-containing protein [Clostridiales bacterium]|nr:DUF4091 domain-containing protein [Clostridiales bacterium]